MNNNSPHALDELSSPPPLPSVPAGVMGCESLHDKMKSQGLRSIVIEKIFLN